MIFSDVNADGFIDIVTLSDTFQTGPVARVFLSNRVSGWNGSSWSLDYGGFSDWVPSYVSEKTTADYTQIADINNDGLPDIIVAARDWHIYGTPFQLNPSPGQWVRIFLNTGKGWIYDPSTSTPVQGTNPGTANYPTPQPYRIVWHETNAPDPNLNPTTRSNWVVDINGDGLPDLLTYGSQVYLSNGKEWVLSPFYTSALQQYYATPSRYGYVAPRQFGDTYFDGLVPIDINGDGVIDLDCGAASFLGNPNPNLPWTGSGVFLNQNKVADVLTGVTFPTGGSISVTYKSSSQYKDVQGNELNPNLPMIVQTVSKISADDGFGNVNANSYSYEGGLSYFDPANPIDRRFAGFGAISRTDLSGSTRKSYFHQGNGSNALKGEFNDEYSKIGKTYRNEIYDSGGQLLSKSIQKWDSLDLGNGRKFVKLTQSVQFDFDGTGNHRDKAESYTYNDSNGNVTQHIQWGEVTGNDNGSFTDIANDSLTTAISYATGSSVGVLDRRSQETTTDQASAKVKESKFFYDTLPFGQVDKGNQTRQEELKTGSTYIHATKTYNALGLVSVETDPRDKPTTYTYDIFNLYPASVTNALNQTTRFDYDYACGAIKQKTDPNGWLFQTTYDGVCRISEEREPDPAASSPSVASSAFADGFKRKGVLTLAVAQALVTKTTYAYTDVPLSVSIKKTDYLDATLTNGLYTYLDGLGRIIQTRKQTETTDTFTTKDIQYNNRGLIAKESLPYLSNGSARTAATTANALLMSYAYDGLERIVTTTTALGPTTNTYNNWKLTITDANGKSKDLFKDAYDRLVQVDEHNGSATYSTKYEYNSLGKLVKITDAMGNVRNFAYDGLGRRLRAEDLHAPADTTFGVWNYDFDDSGNNTTRLDANGQSCIYKYDDLNRLQSEDFLGQSGIEVTYGYDACAGGIGRLCSVSKSAFSESLTYNSQGLVRTDNKIIEGLGYNTSYNYDRQGHQTLITNPDGSVMSYRYNSAALIEQVSIGPNASQLSLVVQNVDYSPLEQIAFMQYSTGARTTNTYDSTKLYRLQRKVTLLPVLAPLPLPVVQPATTTKTKKLPSKLQRILLQKKDILPEDIEPNLSPETNPSPTITGTQSTVDKVMQDLTYDYDNVNNVKSIVDASDTDTKKTTTFTYDDLYRLTGASTTGAANGQNYSQTYSYDPIGNFVMKSDQGTYFYLGNTGSSYANPHAVTATAIGQFQTTYQYDNNGNLTSSNSGIFNRWDYNSHLLQSFVGETAVAYAYDHSGQRIKYSNGFNTTHYPTKNYNVSLTRTVVKPGVALPDNAVKHIFIGDLLVATVKGTLHPSVYAIHTDHLTGSSVVTNSSGQIEELTDYYPFGDIRLEENRGFYNEQRKFAGHELDSDTGLTYMDARYYGSSTGRFISQDAAYLSVGATFPSELLTNPQTLNSYSYANNNPLTHIDADGNLSINVFGFLPESTQISIGNWANNLYSRSSVARALLDHPYAPAIVGSAPLAAYGAIVYGPSVAAGAADLATAIGPERAIKGAVGAGLNVGSTYLNAKIEGRRVSAGEVAFAATTGAIGGNLPSGFQEASFLKGGFAALSNAGQQAAFQRGHRINRTSVAISFVATSASSRLLNLGVAPEFYKSLTESFLNFSFEQPAQTINSGVNKTREQRKKGR